MHTRSLARYAVELVLCGIDTVAARAVVGSLTGWLLALGVNDAPFVSIHVHARRHGGEAYWLEILLFSFYCKNMDKDTDWKDALFLARHLYQFSPLPFFFPRRKLQNDFFPPEPFPAPFLSFPSSSASTLRLSRATMASSSSS